MKSAVLVLIALSAAARAHDLPPGFVLQPIGSGFTLPIDVAFLDAGRMLVGEKAGRVWLVEDDVRRNLVVDLALETLTSGDRGLLAVEADPAFAVNGWIYLLYVVDPNGDGSDDEEASFARLTRLTATFDAQGELHADVGSRLDLIGATWSSGIPSCHLSHAVGALCFPGDGSLVLATGDGASYDGPDGGGVTPGCFGPEKLGPEQDVGAFRSQLLSNLSGKLLRVDPATGLGLSDNPFFGGDPSAPSARVFALGLRNPFRFVQVNAAGSPPAFLVADVGWDRFEELDLARGGENFGWPCSEGASPAPEYRALPGSSVCGAHGIPTLPLIAVDHSDSLPLGFTAYCLSGLARPTAASYPPLYQGRLFFCDYAADWIFAAALAPDLSVHGVIDVAKDLDAPIDLATDPSTGELVFIELGTSTVERLRYVGAGAPPVIVASVEPRFGPLPLTVQVSASGSWAPSNTALAYRWDFGDGTYSADAHTQKTYLQEGSYLVRLLLTDAMLLTSTKEFLVTPGNTPPSAVIQAPLPGTLYQDGEVVLLQGSAQDAEDRASGVAPDEQWQVVLLHDHHEHPDFASFTGSGGSFVFDSHGPGTWIEARYRVTDSHGLETTATVALYDAAGTPRAHIVSVSDATPRVGQPVQAIGHVHHPGDVGGAADLDWDWGDGTHSVFPASAHFADTAPVHSYSAEQGFTIRLTATLGATAHTVTQTIQVGPARPAVAIFTPLVNDGAIPWADQQSLAESLAASLGALGAETVTFRFDQQAALASWMQAYRTDGVRDLLLMLDAAPAAIYAGEDDGSLAEQWLEGGNAIVWTGAEPFAKSVTALGQSVVAGASASDLFDGGGASLCDGDGWQVLSAKALVELPALVPFASEHALHHGKLAPAWHAGPVYALGADKASDAVVVTNAAGGFYAQFFCTSAAGLPREAVLFDFLRARL